MNGDKKTGLALGVLLVGIVGAFFFRNESSPLDAPIPQLENPQKLDAQIAEKSRIPYLTGVETDDPLSDAPPFVAPAAPGGMTERNVSDLTPSIDSSAFESRLAASAPAPDPIRAPAAVEGGRFGHNSAWEVVGDGTPPVAHPVVSTAVSDRMHEVKAGDTLSGLAFQYLGSSARYHEIFQANRDLLKSPNDLRIGLKLRIPPRDAPRSIAGEPLAPPGERRSPIPARTIQSSDGPSARNVAAPTNVEVLPAAPAEEPPSQPPPSNDGRLFRPVPRQPFMPGRSGGGASLREIPAQPVKSLSQQPPQDLPVVDESAWSEPGMKRERTSAPFKKEHSGPEAANKNDRAAARLVDAIEDGNPFDVD